MKSYKSIVFTILIVFVSGQINGQDTTTMNYVDKIKNFDLALIWIPDSIIGEDGWEGAPADKIKRAEPIGYIDTSFQRFHIHFFSVSKNKNNPYEYIIRGKTMVKNKICDFHGTVTITHARLYNKSEFQNYKQGYVIGNVLFYENKNQTGSGQIKGKLKSLFAIDDKGIFRYDGLMMIGDGFHNNQFECKWTSYNTKKSKKCNWGDYRIPDSNNLDYGTGEFSVNPKYIRNGWENYGYGINQIEWWK